MINLAIYILLGVNILVCILLTVLVLMQKPRSEGLGAAFGGSFADSIFGAQTSDVLTKGTIWLGVIFMTLTLLLGLLYSHRQAGSNKLQEELKKPLSTVSTNSVPAPVPVTSSTSATNNSATNPTAPAPANH